jgi:hypothetical protein
MAGFFKNGTFRIIVVWTQKSIRESLVQDSAIDSTIFKSAIPRNPLIRLICDSDSMNIKKMKYLTMRCIRAAPIITSKPLM